MVYKECPLPIPSQEAWVTMPSRPRATVCQGLCGTSAGCPRTGLSRHASPAAGPP